MEFINSKSLYIDSNKGQVRIGSISNAVSGLNSSVLGGNNNIVHENSNNSAILGGQNNTLSANNSFIVGNNVLATQSYTLYTDNVNIKGDLTISGIITGSKTNSLNWNSVYSYTNTNSSFDQASRSFVNANSATILNGYNAFNWVFANSATELAVTSFVNAISAKGLTATAFVNSNSASIINGYKGSNWVFANSATELAVTSFVNANSATILNGYKGSNWVFANSATELAVTSIVNNTSANWITATSFVNANSATILNGYKGSNWVFANSATELAVTSIVNNTSANWNSVYSYTNTNSSFDQASRSFVNSNSASIINGYKGSNWVFANSATELAVTSIVNNTSANWNSVYSNVNATSANWNSVYSNVNSNSATYATILFTNNKFLPLSGGQVTGNLNITNNLSAVNVKFTGRVEEGTGTKALGTDSHAEGNSTTASGTATHAEGFNTIASGNFSHSEGRNTISSGQYCHTEGFASIASGNYSHAEGDTTVASGNYSHAEGYRTEAVGIASRAAGYKATAANDYSYAWSGESTLTNNVSTTKDRQYFIYAPSGVYIPRGQVGIGTDSQENALTVVGVISGTNIVYANNGNSNQWNSVYSNVNANSATYATIAFANNKFIPLSGGQWTGSLRYGTNDTSYPLNIVGGAARIGNGDSINDLTVGYDQFGGEVGVISVNTDGYIAAYHSGDHIYQYGPSDNSGLTIDAGTGNTGINTTTPNQRLTVSGNISSNGTIFTTNGNSNQWNSVYSNINANSGTYATQNYVKNNFLPLSGGTLTGQLNVTSNISATQVVYSKELDFSSLERPSLTGIKQALNAFLYVAPNLEYFRINGSNTLTLEVGQSLTSPVLTWKSTKAEPQAVSKYTLTLPDDTSTVGTNTFTFSSYNDINTYNILNIGGTATRKTSSWNVKVTDWSNAEYTETLNANWQYRVYFGATNQLSASDVQIISGADSSTLAISRLNLGAKTVLPSNEYVYVAYPQRFGTTSLLRLNGFNFNDMDLLTITPFTNIYGGFDNYYVYRTRNLLTGTYTIEII